MGNATVGNSLSKSDTREPPPGLVSNETVMASEWYTESWSRDLSYRSKSYVRVMKDRKRCALLSSMLPKSNNVCEPRSRSKHSPMMPYTKLVTRARVSIQGTH